MNINCLIIDDEPSSQTVLKHFISEISFLTLKGCCNSGMSALQKLEEVGPIDLLLLDINMPKISGIDFYKSLQNPPEVIFTTAYPKYAVQGFEVNAIDYLLKPFSFERFFTAINKFVDKNKLHQKEETTTSYLLVKSNKVLHKIEFDAILFIEAFGDYVKIFLKGKTILTCSTFSQFLKKLPQQFIRTHKSFAINIKQMNRIDGNRIHIQEHTIPIGLTYKEDFLIQLSFPKK
ncbi:MAG: LytTR family DNA-binding domain-containing protein [Cellulophaga sp.]